MELAAPEDRPPMQSLLPGRLPSFILAREIKPVDQFWNRTHQVWDIHTNNIFVVDFVNVVLTLLSIELGVMFYQLVILAVVAIQSMEWGVSNLRPSLH